MRAEELDCRSQGYEDGYEEGATAERERCASRALAIVNVILEDLTDRRGLSQEWEHIDMEIQMEIINAWKGAVVAVIYQGG